MILKELTKFALQWVCLILYFLVDEDMLMSSLLFLMKVNVASKGDIWSIWKMRQARFCSLNILVKKVEVSKI